MPPAPFYAHPLMKPCEGARQALPQRLQRLLAGMSPACCVRRRVGHACWPLVASSWIEGMPHGPSILSILSVLGLGKEEDMA